MKKLFLLFLIVPSVAFGQNNVSDLIGLRMSTELASKIDQIYSSAVGTDQVFTGTAQPKFPAAPVITPATAATAVAAAPLTRRNSILAAGAPTAAFVALPAATAVVGESYTIYNQGSNPLQIVPGAGNTANVAGATTPFACATAKECECVGLTSTNFGCTAR
jgi:hypothetical protein